MRRAGYNRPMSSGSDQVTLRALHRMVDRGERIPALTCYDATTARWLARGGIPLLLVGDTAAETILGYDQTIHAPLDFLIQLTAAVKRGAPSRFVMADMPFMSYQVDDAEAIRNAGRFLTEGDADAVKLEVDASFGDLVSRLVRAGIPVVAHLGSLPQHVRQAGGYRSVGRTAEEGRALVEQAVDMERRGVAMLLLEATPAEVSAAIVERVSVPVIGCGAGPACHGEVVVLHDLLGLTDWQPPFATPMVAVGEQLADTSREWARHVRNRTQPGRDAYGMYEGEAARLAEALSRPR